MKHILPEVKVPVMTMSYERSVDDGVYFLGKASNQIKAVIILSFVAILLSLRYC